MNSIRSSVVAGCALALMAASGMARAATTTTPVEGRLGISAQACLQLLTFQVGNFENCMYNGGPSLATIQPYGELTGPYTQVFYYDSLATPQAFDTGWQVTPGDGKSEQILTGEVTIDDNGTPGDPTDDLISFTLTLTSAGGGDIIRWTDSPRTVERYSSMTQELAPWPVDSATPNGFGGFDYVIGSQGFPALRVHNQPPCIGQPFGSLDCVFSFSLDPNDPLAWDGVSAAGLGSLEGNRGARPTGTVTDLACISNTNLCEAGKMTFAPRVIGPNLAPGGGVTAETVGWDQLVLRVATDAEGKVITLAGFDVQESQSFGPNFPCGDDPGATINCNTWISGYFFATGEGVVLGTAFDDGPFHALEGVPLEIDVLENDLGFSDPVEVTLFSPPPQGTAVITGSPGDAADIRIEYTANIGAAGWDSFVYAVTDGAASDIATVTLFIGTGANDDSDQTTRNQPVVIAVGLNDFGFGDTATVTVDAGSFSAGGSAIVSAGNGGPAGEILVTYTPASAPGSPAYVETFSYTISDGDSESDTARVTVTVGNSQPAIQIWPISTYQDEASQPTNLSPFITRGDGSLAQHAVTVSVQAANGSCAVNPANAGGELVYTPDPGYFGPDSCTLTVADLDGEEASQALAITVREVAQVEGRVGGAGAMPVWSLLLLLLAGIRRRWRYGTAGLLGALLAASPAALAQLDEIVVTARRVEERLQDVPLSVTAFDAATIAAAGITNLHDVAALTPGLNFFNPLGEFYPVPVIRGVAPTDIFGRNNAAVFIDGVYVSGRRGLNFSQLDLERIEVIKGPVSALYGREAFSGAINYVTRAPSEEFEAKLGTEIGNRGKMKGSMMVSGPLAGETLRGRLSFLYDDWDGSYDNAIPGGPDIGGHRFRSMQGSVLWLPAPELDFRLSYYHSNDSIDESAVVGFPANCEDHTDMLGVRLQNFCGRIPGIRSAPGLNGGRAIPKIHDATGERREIDRLQLVINWEIGTLGTLTSLSGYQDIRQDYWGDFNHSLGYDTPFLYCPDATLGERGTPNACNLVPANERFFTGIAQRQNGDTVTEYSQELRFISPVDRSLRYSLGGYWYQVTQRSYPGNVYATHPLPAPAPGAEAIGLPPFSNDPADPPNFLIGTAIFYNTFTPDGGLDPLNRLSARSDTDAWAVFGTLDFDLSERLTARTELRYSRERLENASLTYQRCLDRSDAGIELCGDDVFDLRVLEPQPFLGLDEICEFFESSAARSACSARRSARFSSITGRVGLDFKLTPDWMIYGSIARGEKPGGLLLVRSPIVPPDAEQYTVFRPNPFDPEKITAYELGIRGTFPDWRLNIDAAVFYNDWKAIVLRQLVDIDAETGLPFNQPRAFNVNAGDATVLGAELSLALGLTDHLRVNATFNWQDAELDRARQDSYETFPTFAPDGGVSGNKLLRQPEWMSSLSVTYRRPLPWLVGWEWSIRGDGTYESATYIGNDNQSWLPGHGYLNLRAGARSDRLTVDFWVRNLRNNGSAIAAFRDIYWTNTDNLYPPYVEQDPRPGFNQFPPFRYTVTYPRLRTYGVNFDMRFGRLAR